MREGKTPIARCAEAQNYHSLADIDRPDVRVVVNPGGANERFARSHLKAAPIRVFPDNRAIFEEIAEGRADVMMTDASETKFQAKQHPGVLCAIHPDKPFDFAEKAYWMRRDATLKAFVDTWLRISIESGDAARPDVEMGGIADRLHTPGGPMAEHDPTEHFEHAEHAEHVAHLGDPFMTKVSVTIALLAVLAATVGSLETIETADVTVTKNEAVLLQNKATDNWNFFQAKSLKKNLLRNRGGGRRPQIRRFRQAGQALRQRAGRDQEEGRGLRAQVGGAAARQRRAREAPSRADRRGDAAAYIDRDRDDRDHHERHALAVVQLDRAAAPLAF